MPKQKFKSLKALKKALDAGKFDADENPLMLDNDCVGLGAYDFERGPEELLIEALELLGFTTEHV